MPKTWWAGASGNAFAEGYKLGDFRADARASLAIFLVALPLALALGVAVDLPPQYGLYSAIIRRHRDATARR